MGNIIFQAILDEKIEKFRFAFEQTSKKIFFDETEKKLIHPGEYGMYREAVCKEYLRVIIPTRLEIGQGFLINDIGETSTQCDLVIFDRNTTPLIESDERQRFFPIETVCAIGEVKSDLDRTDLKKALNKLARNKLLREKMTNPTAIKRDHSGNFDPINYPYDNIFSFLICNKFTFDFSDIVNEIDSYYEQDIKPWQKHNLILSVNDGLLAYYDNSAVTFMYPYTKNGLSLKNRFVKPDKNKNVHFLFLSSYIFMGTTSSSIYYPEMSNYLVNFNGGQNINQK